MNKKIEIRKKVIVYLLATTRSRSCATRLNKMYKCLPFSGTFDFGVRHYCKIDDNSLTHRRIYAYR